MHAPTLTLPAYLHSLNPPQRQAVEMLDGPLLVLAGAGTGKTRVLTTRIQHLLRMGKAAPYQVLAVTFTNKAAREMLERIARELPADGLWLGTFHSICARMLRRHAELMGLPQSFTIIDMDDQIRLIKTLLLEQNIDIKKVLPKVVAGIIQRWKDLGLRPEAVTSSYTTDLYHHYARDIYPRYQARLMQSGAVDFGDLLLHVLTLFTNHPDVLSVYQEQFKYVLVDEYQDTNVAQYLWLRMLASAHKNICCVGDDDQSIYGWRGAEVGNILKFEKDFPQAGVVRLEQNYRSTNHILATASAIIACNEQRLGKTLWTDKTEGEKVRLLAVWDEREEARSIAAEIETLQRLYGQQLDQVAILVRAGFQTRAFEECFVQTAIPYRVIGGLRFYERMEIRDAIAYIRATLRPEDDLALERIINTPKRSLGDSTLSPLRHDARSQNISLATAIQQALDAGTLKARGGVVLKQLFEQFEKWRAAFAIRPHAEVVQQILEESGYIDMWKKERSIEADGRIENLKELVHALGDFSTITDFLEHVSLVMENETNDNQPMVNIMTLHAAKGLEFQTVFLPGWEEGIFPHQRVLEENGSKGIEEERRLAYVGITRAMERLYILHAANRRIYNQWQNSMPSRFLKELDAEAIDAVLPQNGLHLYPTKLVETYRSTSSTPIELLREPDRKEPTIAAGNRVFHQKFGYGKVMGVEGDHLDILFDKAGRKKIIESFVNKV